LNKMPIIKRSNKNSTSKLEYPINIRLIESDITITGGTRININIQCSPQKLLNRGINTVVIKTDNPSITVSKKSTANALISRIYQTSKKEEKIASITIDLKEFASSADIQAIGQGKKIVEHIFKTKKEYSLKSINELPTSRSNSFLQDRADTISRSEHANKPRLIFNPHANNLPLPSVFEDVTTVANKNTPLITKIKKVKVPKMMSKNIAINLPNSKYSQNIQLVAQLKNKNNKTVIEFPIGLSDTFKLETSEYINDISSDKTGIEVFYKLSLDSSFLTLTGQQVTTSTGPAFRFNVTNIPPPITGIIVYRKNMNQVKNMFWKVDERSFNARTGNKEVFIHGSITGRGVIYKVVPTINGRPIYGITKSFVMENSNYNKFNLRITSVQEGRNVKLNIFNIPVEIKALTITRRNLDNMSQSAAVGLIQISSNNTGVFIDSTVPLKKASYAYEITDATPRSIYYGICSNIYVNYYNFSTRYSAKIISAIIENKIAGVNSYHKLTGEIQASNLWYPADGEKEISDMTSSIIKSIIEKKNIIKIHVLRLSDKGETADFGIFCINPSISDIPSKKSDSSDTIEFILKFDKRFCLSRNQNYHDSFTNYTYVVRPIIYPMGNELAFIKGQPRITVPAEKGKTGYKLDPFVFDNPSKYELGILGNNEYPNRNQLYEDGKIAEVLTADISSKVKNKNISSSERSVLISTYPGYYINRKTKLNEKYIRISLILDEITMKNTSKIEIFAASSSTGIQELLTTVTPFNEEIIIYDFISYVKETDSLTYTLRVFDLNYNITSNKINSKVKL